MKDKKITEMSEKEALKIYIETSCKMGISLFKHYGLISHIQGTVIDQITGESYSFNLIKNKSTQDN